MVHVVVRGGFTPVWLDGNRAHFFEGFMRREHGNPIMEAHYQQQQLERITQAGALEAIDWRIVDPFQPDGTSAAPPARLPRRGRSRRGGSPDAAAHWIIRTSMIPLSPNGRASMNIVDVATVAGGVAAVVAVILTLIDRRRSRRERELPPSVPAAPTVPPEPAHTPQPMLEATPDAWGQPVPALDTGKALSDLLSIVAYLFGLLAALPLLAVRRRVIRYHALQSIGIDILTFGYMVAGTVVGVTWGLIRYGGDPFPSSDPVLTAFVAGIFVVELLPRFYCILQIVRERPARVPWVWRMAATLAGRAPRP